MRGESRRAGVKKSENKQHNTVGQTERLKGVTLPEGWFMTKSGKCCLSHNDVCKNSTMRKSIQSGEICFPAHVLYVTPGVKDV